MNLQRYIIRPLSLKRSERLKTPVGRKSKSNFAPFDLVKIRGEKGKMSESVLAVQPRAKPLTYFWHRATQPSGKL